jgi:hypothetical protein
MPRVSRPYDPASARKHGVWAVTASGNSAASMVSPANRLVSGTSAVGIRNISRPATAVRNRSSSNFGSWPVPVMVCLLTSVGTAYSV